MQDNTLKKYNFFNKREIITEISNDYEKINLTNLIALILIPIIPTKL